MTSRAMLQEKSLDELRVIAASLGVARPRDAAEVQDSSPPSSAPTASRRAPSRCRSRCPPSKRSPRRRRGQRSLEDAAPRRGRGGARGRRRPRARSPREDRWEGGSRSKRRRRRGGGSGSGSGSGGRPTREPYYDEAELEVREGILDLLPRGLRLPPGHRATCPATRRRLRLGQADPPVRPAPGDVLAGPAAPAPQPGEFPALLRIDTVNGIDPERGPGPPPSSAT